MYSSSHVWLLNEGKMIITYSVVLSCIYRIAYMHSIILHMLHKIFLTKCITLQERVCSQGHSRGFSILFEWEKWKDY